VPNYPAWQTHGHTGRDPKIGNAKYRATAN